MSGTIAVDGGQSAIRVRHSESARVIELEGVSRLEGDPVASVATLIGRAMSDGCLPAADLAVLGLTTSPSAIAEQNRLCELVFRAGGPAEIWLADDSVTSHIGALSGGYGVSVVVGTGVACLSRGVFAPPRVFDGYGYLLGDDGGAWSIGRAGLRAALAAHAHRGPATILVERANDSFGALEGLHIRLHESSRPVNAIAHFARQVVCASGEGDPVSSRILDRAASELRDTTLAAARWAGTANVPVALGGRLLEPESPLRKRLDDLLVTEKLVVARSADGGPLDGALALGRSGGEELGELVHRWREGESS